MADIFQIISPFTGIIDSLFPDKLEVKLQELLVRGGTYRKPSEILTILVIATIIMFVATWTIVPLFQFGMQYLLIGPLVPVAAFGTILMLNIDNRLGKIENATPDFLRQVSSLINAGVGLEQSIDDISQEGDDPLTSELKRAVIEMKIGVPFEDALMGVAARVKSKNLDRSFRMIIEGKKAGGSMSDVIETVADDLRETLALQRERKSSVMMSVMFIGMAVLIAAPLAFAMMGSYNALMASSGKSNPLEQEAVFISGAYVVINALLGGILTGIVRTGKVFDGLKFSIIYGIISYAMYKGLGLATPFILGG